MTAPCEFSLAHYREILESAGRQYHISPFSGHEALRGTGRPLLLLRHDLDSSLGTALEMAELEHGLGVRATYFVQIHGDSYGALTPAGTLRVRQLREWGHEIGLHFDPAYYDAAGVDFKTGIARDLESLSGIAGEEIVSVARHLPLLSHQTGEFPPQVRYDAFNARFINGEFKYVSDSNGLFREGCFCRHLPQSRDYCFLIHPVWWVNSGATWQEKLRNQSRRDAREGSQRVEGKIRQYESILAKRDSQDQAFQDRLKEGKKTAGKFPGMTLILTGAGAPGWPDIRRCLVENNEREIRIVGVDMAEDAAGYHLSDASGVVPPGKDPGYTARMRALAEQHGAGAIVPLTDFELLPLSGEKAYYGGRGVALPLAETEPLTIATDKITLHGFLRRSLPEGLPAFRTALTIQEFEKGVRELGYPGNRVCFKPGVAHGSRGFRILDPSARESEMLFSAKAEEARYSMTLEKAMALLGETPFPPLLLTEYLPGMEYSVDVLIREKTLLAAVCRERTRVRFGLTYFGKVVDRPDLCDLAGRIALAVGLTYNANLQFKCDAKGRPMILEINPRTSGTIALCRAAGVNLPYLGLKLALGEEVRIPPVSFGTRNYRYWTHVFLGPSGKRVDI